MEPSLGKIPTTSARRLTSLFSPLQRVRAVDAGAVLSGEIQVRQHVDLAVVDERAELRPLAAELVGDVAERLAGGDTIRLNERLSERRGRHALLRLRDVGQRVAHPMDPTPLPRGAEHAADRRLEPLVRVGDHQLHAAQAAPEQALEEGRPEGLRLRRSDVQAHDLALAVRVHCHGDYRRHRDDPSPSVAIPRASHAEPLATPPSR